MRVNRYSQIPQLMTGQLISPARAVFAIAAAGSRGVETGGLQLSSGSVELINTVGGGSGSRGVGETPDTLFLLSSKPKSTRTSRSIPLQFFM
jgi:hypothetical protein